MNFDWAGFFAPWMISGSLLVLHVVLPARRVAGYVRDAKTGRPFRYRINGLLVFIVAVGLWWWLGARGWVRWDWLWIHRWASLAGACVLGIVFSVIAVWTGVSTGRGILADFFFGRRLNPRAFGDRVDVKMVLYLIGGTLLELNILAFAMHHWTAFSDDPSPGVAVHLALFSWFVLDYFVFERVHLYTFDLFAERVGFKLGWGCLAFYPYFYAVGLWSTVDRPNPDSPGWWFGLSALLFFCGWVLARGANLQKFTYKIDPSRVFLGLIPPKTIGDGQQQLICSGFWGVSRHVNYLGEILMAVGLALSLGWPLAIGPWLYPLYYLVLLGGRERDDDRRCADKYGPLWDRYREEVRWRIVPGIY